MVRPKTAALLFHLTGSCASLCPNTNDWAAENDHRDVLKPLLGKSQRSSTGESDASLRKGDTGLSMTIEFRERVHYIRGCGAVCHWEDPRHRRMISSRVPCHTTVSARQAWMSQMKSRHFRASTGLRPVPAGGKTSTLWASVHPPEHPQQ